MYGFLAMGLLNGDFINPNDEVIGFFNNHLPQGHGRLVDIDLEIYDL